MNIHFVELKKISKILECDLYSTREYQDEKTGRWFFLYTENKFAELLKKSEFRIIKQNVRHRETEQQWLQTWLTFFIEKK